MLRLSTQLFSIFVFLFLVTACATPFKQKSYHVGYREVGLASWYGKDFHGRPTASGEIYNMFGISAAHKSFPLGTLLRVTVLETGQVIEVKVNDRGPFIQNRILDLSYGAARELGIVGLGLAKIELEVVGRFPIFLPDSIVEKAFFVQVGSYQVRENALRMKRKMARFYQPVSVKSFETTQGRMYRVHLGPYETEEEARSTVGKLRTETSLGGEISPIVVLKQ